MKRIRAAMLLAAGACCAFAQSRAWQDTITLPTWVEGAPDIHPKIDTLDPGASYYPYTGRTNFGKTREPQLWRRLNLENEYLSCSFLPDLGGHLYTCTDKRNGRPIFRANGSVKKADVGPRGAWVAMGIEFNFPVAHSRYTVSPVDFGLRQQKDHAEIWLGCTDRVTGMRWLAEFILRDGSAALEQRVTLSNPTAARHPYLWWANADIDLEEGTRFVYPANVMATHAFTDLYPWPLDKKTDLSKPFTVQEMIGLFAYGSREPFFGIYDAGSRTAVVHVADPAVVTGKKLFHWGSSLPWARQHLSDDNSGYVEMQSGLFENQATYEFLEPGAETKFSELWMSGRDLNGISRANEHGILSLERLAREGKSELVTQLSVTHSIAGAALALYNDSKLAWQDKADLSPATNYERAFPGPERTAAYRFELRDSAGKLLMTHAEGAYEAVTQESVKLGPQKPRGPGGRRDSAEDFLAAGEFDERASLYRVAEGEYRAGLKRFTNDLPLEKALGRLLASRERYAEAVNVLSDASKKLYLDPEIRYYLGVALAASGKEAEARQSWRVSTPDSRFGAPSLVELAALEARAGHAAAALDLAQEAIKRRPALLRARELEAALLRHAGHSTEARRQVDEGLAADPLDSFLRLESILLGAKDDELWPHLAADSERVLDVADRYLAFGFYEDALHVLSHKYEAVPLNQTDLGAPPPQENALVSYYRGYCEAKLGRDAPADFKLAASQPLEYVFPRRATSLAVLDAARASDPKDASAIFLTGLLYLDENRVADAAGLFKAALAIRKDIPGIYYLLGRTLLVSGETAEAMAILREGAAMNPSDKALKSAIEAAVHPPKPAVGAAAPAVTPSTPAGAGSATPVVPVSSAPRAAVKPIEIAMMALASTAEGTPATDSFNARNFPEEKQPALVRQVYIEIQLQALRRNAAKKDCATALTELDRMGGENKDLPFTLQGFDPFMKGARFQYFLGAVESLCGLSKEAKRRWGSVAKMTPAVASADFAFPAVAEQNLSKAADLQLLLDKVNHALDAAGAESKGLLYYSRGILLLAKGDERSAMAAFEAGGKAPDRDLSQYLNQSALSEAVRAASGK
jgi:Flp pilus assembly protein TadD